MHQYILAWYDFIELPHLGPGTPGVWSGMVRRHQDIANSFMPSQISSFFWNFIRFSSFLQGRKKDDCAESGRGRLERDLPNPRPSTLVWQPVLKAILPPRVGILLPGGDRIHPYLEAKLNNRKWRPAYNVRASDMGNCVKSYFDTMTFMLITLYKGLWVLFFWITDYI